jgi:hypothetical protein
MTIDILSARCEAREDTLRIVEYTGFPRLVPEARPRLGFTRDLSLSGLCLGTEAAEPIGSLLRVTVLEIDGRATPASVHRVVWCSSERDGRFWLGLELLAEPQERMHRVSGGEGRNAASA